MYLLAGANNFGFWCDSGSGDLDVDRLSAIQDAGSVSYQHSGYYEICNVPNSIKPSYIRLGHIFPYETKD